MMSATTWVIDTIHSDVLFKIKHLVISNVTGSFKKFEGNIVAGRDDFNNAKVNFTIDVKSIDTNQAQRMDICEVAIFLQQIYILKLLLSPHHF